LRFILEKMKIMCWQRHLKNALQKAGERLIVLGIGREEYGDDAVGIEAIRSLWQVLPPDDGVSVLYAGTSPENLTGLIRTYRPDAVLMIDAVEINAIPGTIRLIDWKDTVNFSAMGHSLPLSMFAQYLSEEVRCKVLLLGVQVEQAVMFAPMSDTVQKSIQHLVEGVRRAIEARNEEEMLQLTIDHQVVSAREGETILEAARRHQKFIPGLCHLDGLSPVGSCRLCLVEVEGQPGQVTACTTKVQDEMVVTTCSDRLRSQQRMLLQMLFASGYHVCAVCESNGACELQALAYRLGVTHLQFEQRRAVQPLDLSHDRYGFDPNRCVLCTRCVRACSEVEGAGIWTVMERGSESIVAPGSGDNWAAAVDCTQCGKCVAACPTGALFDKRVSTAEMKKDCAILERLKQHQEATL
jgi:bidirectional [NiFe] hydrogenase diaphorase subunit